MKAIRTSPRVVQLIKRSEGFRSTPYICPGGVLTIGYGHTESVIPDMRVTKKEAEALLLADLKRIEEAIAPLITVELGEDQFSACVSLAYNVGIGAFSLSTLLRKINAGDMPGAASEFLRWCHVKGRRTPGLLRRREIEREVFLRQEHLII